MLSKPQIVDGQVVNGAEKTAETPAAGQPLAALSHGEIVRQRTSLAQAELEQTIVQWAVTAERVKELAERKAFLEGRYAELRELAAILGQEGSAA